MAILLYDRDCGFCRWSAAKVLAWDRARRLRPLAIQDRAAAPLLSGLDPDERLRSWHLVDDAGRLHSAGEAFAPLLRLLPGGRPLAAAAERFPRAAEAGYRAVAGHRSVLGRLVPARSKARADGVLARRL